jgi:hypothetical protein
VGAGPLADRRRRCARLCAIPTAGAHRDVAAVSRAADALANAGFAVEEAAALAERYLRLW